MEDTAWLDTATQTYAEHRETLFAIVYNLLGTVADAEDVLQETWLSWAAAAREEVANPRAYLVRIAVNEALSRLRRARREEYVGPWLPEPITTPSASDGVVRAEAVSLGLLVVLETLSPLERAVFVLREAFGYEHAEIAAILGRSPAAVRQLARRAREHVRARRPRYEPEPDVRRSVTQRFLDAALGGDLGALLELLAPDVTLWTDGGGRRPAARRPIVGSEKVARLLVTATPGAIPDHGVRYIDVNGGPAAVIFSGGELFAVLFLDLTPDGDRVHGIYGVVNPDKFHRIAAAL